MGYTGTCCKKRLKLNPVYILKSVVDVDVVVVVKIDAKSREEK